MVVSYFRGLHMDFDEDHGKDHLCNDFIQLLTKSSTGGARR